MPIATSTPNAIDPVTVLGQLTVEEKLSLVSGSDMWHTAEVARLGIPRVRMSDGPNGVRGITWTNGATSACFPCATGLAAAFDVDLAKRVGQALGDECRSRGVHCLLGPTTNIQRDPRGGRGFESFSEDPFLSGTLAESWIEGLQSRGVMAYWLANEQELLRHSSNSIIDERTLHEIYVEPFRLLCRAKPATFMSSYNRVNGVHASESPYLLADVLRGQLGFDGLVMSDWGGCYSAAGSIKAGMDIDMPGPTLMRGARLERAVVAGKLTYEDIDTCVLRVLEFVRRAQLSGIPFEAVERPIDSAEIRALLRESAAAAVVLLKNDRNVLPITPTNGMRIAIIGPNANVAAYSGGGSASLPASYTTTPLQCITKAAEAQGATVEYTIGAPDTTRWTPLLTPFLRSGDQAGVMCTFYQEDPWMNPVAKPLFSFVNTSSYCFFTDGVPSSVPVRGYVSLRATLHPDISGTWELGLSVAGQADLYINGSKLIDNTSGQKPDVLFFNTGTEEVTAEIELVGGEVYELEVRFSNFKQISAKSPYCGRRGGIRIGGRGKQDPNEEIQRAAALAQRSDVTIVVVGTNDEWEAESYDRASLALPGSSDALVEAVLAVNPEAIIVNQSGMPVLFPWADDASTLVHAFFGGNESGQAVADVIFGEVNPSGRLPVSWPRAMEDYAAPNDFGHPTTTVYREGLRVGYRHFDGPGPMSQFPFAFGHGLGYTTFSFSELDVIPARRGGATVRVRVRNNGNRAGAEVVQFYVCAVGSTVERPMALKAYSRVHLEALEDKVVDIALTHEAWAYYATAEQRWVAPRGAYEVRVGHSARNIALARPFFLEETIKYVGNHSPVWGDGKTE